MSKAIAGADLRYAAPPQLRRRIEGALHSRGCRTGGRCSGACNGIGGIGDRGDGLVAIILRGDDEQRIIEVVSAHLRSLQAGHADVLSAISIL
jgi:hypothetical protein